MVGLFFLLADERSAFAFFSVRGLCSTFSGVSSAFRGISGNMLKTPLRMSAQDLYLPLAFFFAACALIPRFLMNRVSSEDDLPSPLIVFLIALDLTAILAAAFFLAAFLAAFFFVFSSYSHSFLFFISCFQIFLSLSFRASFFAALSALSARLSVGSGLYFFGTTAFRFLSFLTDFLCGLRSFLIFLMALLLGLTATGRLTGRTCLAMLFFLEEEAVTC